MHQACVVAHHGPRARNPLHGFRQLGFPRYIQKPWLQGLVRALMGLARKTFLHKLFNFQA